MWHPRFIKMKYLTEVWMHTLLVSFFMRVIEECWDPESVVRPTFSEIIVRLDRIFANCSNHGWWKDTFKLPWECLKFIPHEKFSFAKIWLLAAQFEIRQLNLKGARLILGNAIGKAPKDKIFKKYIEIELQLGNIDRCRKLYEKYLECAPENCYAWSKYAELERSLSETERARSIFELAIAQPALDMP